MIRRLVSFLLAALAASPALAQDRVVLIEEGTGNWARWCTDAEWRLDAFEADHPGRVVVVQVHVSDGMESPDEYIDAAIVAYPAAVIDRQDPEYRDRWAASLAPRLLEPPGATLELATDYDPGSRTLTVELEVEFLVAAPGATAVGLLLIEDGVTGSGIDYDQYNAHNEDPGHPYEGAGNPIVGFVHDRVMRAAPAPTSPAGIPAGAEVGARETRTWSVVLPAAWNEANLRVVAYLEDEGALLGPGEVWNAAVVPALAPELVVEAGAGAIDAIDLGRVRVGEPATTALEVRNAGHAPGTVDALVVSPAPFALGTDGCSGSVLAPGESCTFDVVVTPAASGALTGSIEVQHAIPGHPGLSVELAAFGDAAPVGVPDAYETPAGVNLAVLPPGVLRNDSDDGPMAVALVAPLEGLTLVGDGSFLYVPGEAGEVTFEYHPTDSLGLGDPVAVTITVVPPADGDDDDSGDEPAPDACAGCPGGGVAALPVLVLGLPLRRRVRSPPARS